MQDPKIIIALDFDQRGACLALVDHLDPSQCRLKIGKEMFTLFGPELVRELQLRGFEIFLDLKFHDIPNTVAKAIKASAELGVWMVNVHASGGERMMRAAKDALADYPKPPKLIAVTVLTSMEQSDLQDVGVAVEPAEQVRRLAQLTADSGLDGVVCSAQEASLLKGLLGPDFCLVTPGIRPAGSAAGDQRRVMTPRAALEAGSDYLVIGRPITQADDPAQIVAEINASLADLIV
jgi:orotidine-5'-phosphate decarboxylase